MCFGNRGTYFSVGDDLMGWGFGCNTTACFPCSTREILVSVAGYDSDGERAGSLLMLWREATKENGRLSAVNCLVDPLSPCVKC